MSSPLHIVEDASGRRIVQPWPAGAITEDVLHLIQEQPSNLINTLNTPVQTVLPVASRPVLVPDPVSDPGPLVTTAVVNTGTSPSSGIVAWAKQNPFMAALIVGSGLYLISKSFKK